MIKILRDPFKEEIDFSLISDIDKCLEEEDISKRMQKFIFIYEQTPDDIREELSTMKDLYDRCRKRLKDMDFSNKIRLYNQVIRDGAGTLLFDENVIDKPKYDLNFFNDIHELSNDMNILIPNILGLLKSKLKKKDGIDIKGIW